MTKEELREGLETIRKEALGDDSGYLVDSMLEMFQRVLESKCQKRVECIFKEIEDKLGIPQSTKAFLVAVTIHSEWWQALKKKGISNEDLRR